MVVLFLSRVRFKPFGEVRTIDKKPAPELRRLERLHLFVSLGLSLVAEYSANPVAHCLCANAGDLSDLRHGVHSIFELHGIPLLS